MQKNYSKLGGWLLLYAIMYIIWTCTDVVTAYNVAMMYLPGTTYVFFYRLLYEALAVSQVIGIFFLVTRAPFFIRYFTGQLVGEAFLMFLVCVAADDFWVAAGIFFPTLVIPCLWAVYLHNSLRAAVYFQYLPSRPHYHSSSFCNDVAHYIVTQSGKINETCRNGKQSTEDTVFIISWYFMAMNCLNVHRKNVASIADSCEKLVKGPMDFAIDKTLADACFQNDTLKAHEYIQDVLETASSYEVLPLLCRYAAEYFAEGPEQTLEYKKRFFEELLQFSTKIKSPVVILMQDKISLQ